MLFYVAFCFYMFFFFKQKTAYEMRISDWSSDVCSSDLRRDARRHLPCRRGGPPRQHGRGDAERRLAAKLADHPGVGVLPQQPRPDVLAGGGQARQPRAEQAPALDALALDGAEGRQSIYGLRHARRRPAGTGADELLSRKEDR